MEKEATDIIFENGHAILTVGLKINGMLCLVYAAGKGQSRANDDYSRDHEVLVTREKAKFGPKQRMS